MLRKLARTGLIVFFCLGSLIANIPEKYLAVIPITKDFDITLLLRSRVPVYYAGTTVCIAGVDEGTLSLPGRKEIPVSILSEVREDENFYVCTLRDGAPATRAVVSGTIIYRNDEFVLVKAPARKENAAMFSYGFGIRLQEPLPVPRYDVHYPEKITASADSLTRLLCNEVRADSIRKVIAALQSFGTRYLYAATRESVVLWLKNRFISMGYTDVKIDSFLYQNTWQKNVIATLPGTVYPNMYVILGGHYDSYSSGNPVLVAPGADDNASGTCAVLEAARVLKYKNFQPRTSIRFIAFAAEEMGLYGSADYAQKAIASQMNIKAMINHDMISSTNLPVAQSKVSIYSYTGCSSLANLTNSLTSQFTGITGAIVNTNSGGSDSYSFWTRGYPVVYFEENYFSPFYHSPADTIGNYSMPYCAEVIKASVALAVNQSMQPQFSGLQVFNTGNGTQVLVRWDKPAQAPGVYFQIGVGTSPGLYANTYSTTDSVITLSGLTPGVQYYIGGRSLDDQGNSSPYLELSITPDILPAAPLGLACEPRLHAIAFKWMKNSDLDLKGYNIYRTDTLGNGLVKLNQVIVTDSNYVDNTPVDGKYYKYSVKAIDSLGNESGPAVTPRCRAISLNKGILLVNETTVGSGTLAGYTSAQVDSFYTYIMGNFAFEKYITAVSGAPTLSDLGAYSSVVWLGDDMNEMSAPYNAKTEIARYLSSGGKFFYAGYKPAKAFENMTGNSLIFNAGTFMNDYLSISQEESGIITRFQGALTNASAYPMVMVDSAKASYSLNYQLGNIDAIDPSAKGMALHAYMSTYDTSTAQGLLKNKPVVVAGNGLYKTITCSFPLFFMVKNQAKSLLYSGLHFTFGEPVGVREDNIAAPLAYEMRQNYPNPFNPETIIEYAVPAAGKVKLQVYDLLGRNIQTLVNGIQKPGIYHVTFNAGGLSSGVYLYYLTAWDSNGQVTCRAAKKMILQK
ncbi:MAG: M20/M25/M40 family metallo-hydrolase [Ignavibacteria bacterium]|nr:M20/M25/M40 family metallo-hydrolase [Ignavibacteria bacterium]